VKPFQQGRFEELPEKPHRPHRFFDTEPIDLTLSSAPFGSMRVHVKKYGEGPPLLLLHGLMTSSYSFRYVFEPLGERFTCFAPDLPGGGRTDAPMAPIYSPQNLATWLAEVMAALKIQGAPAIANSMGGYLALQAVLQSRAIFERLIVVHSPGVPDLRMHALRFAMAVPGTDRLLSSLVARDPLRWVHKNVHYWDESLKSLEEAHEYAAPLKKDPRILWKYLAETMSTRYMAPFHRELDRRREGGERFPIPLLLLYAERDPMVPPAHGNVFAQKIPDAELIWLSEASHFAHVDAVDRFLPPVLTFLAKR
jgi:pimeloyl-ACP methyl ester carboxylesterase